MGDLIRGALASIEKSQIESARTLRLNHWQIFQHIELLQGTLREFPGR